MRDINDYTNEYEKIPFEAQQVEYRRKLVLKQIEQYPHKRVLEIGCGLKPIFLDFQDFDAMCVVEPSEKFADHAKELAANYRNVKVVQAFFEDAAESLAKENFDYIICSGLLHEVEYPCKVLQAISYLCEKECIVHINVPNARSVHRILAAEMGLIDNVFTPSETNIRMQQHSVFDICSLTQMVEENGFEVITSGTYFVKIFTHSQMQSMLDYKIIDSSVLDGLDRLIKYFPEYGSELYVQLKRKT